MISQQSGPSWMCLWERLCIDMGMKLIHDGKNNPVQFKLPPEQVRFYTRTYQGYMDGQPISAYVKFIYDEREGEVDVEISSKDPHAKGREVMSMSMPKEIVSAKG